MIIKKIKNNKRGFVILFAVTLSAILLSIALGVTNIAFREVKFGTNARETNDAFFAADTGIESVLFQDKTGNYCTSPCSPTEITFSGLGSTNESCAKVRITKTGSSPNILTQVVSNGYNNGSSAGCTPGSNTVERQIKVNY